MLGGLVEDRAGVAVEMNNPAATSGVSFSGLGRHSVLHTESSSISWIPAFAGMTGSRQAAGNVPGVIQKKQ
jgi:hypothetical protein